MEFSNLPCFYQDNFFPKFRSELRYFSVRSIVGKVNGMGLNNNVIIPINLRTLHTDIYKKYDFDKIFLTFIAKYSSFPSTRHHIFTRHFRTCGSYVGGGGADGGGNSNCSWFSRPSIDSHCKYFSIFLIWWPSYWNALDVVIFTNYLAKSVSKTSNKKIKWFYLNSNVIPHVVSICRIVTLWMNL